MNTACLVQMVRLVRWSDDFSLSGRRSLCSTFRNEMGKHLLVKTTAVLGPNLEMGDVQEAIHLNRLVRLYPPGAEGGRGRPSTCRDPGVAVGLNNESKAVSTPGVRMTDEDDGKEVDAVNRACYRSWTMRASYLSQDRCELQFAVKELARRMQQPNTKNMQALKRLVRFLKGSPRCLVVYVHEDTTVNFVFVRDAGWTSACLISNNTKRGGNKLR